MAPGNWPNAAQAADPQVGRARVRRGSRRLAIATQDFLLDPADRLTEQERALMSGMLLGLVERLADEIRVRLPDSVAAACECDAAELVLELHRFGLLGAPGLVGLLLRRADIARLVDVVSTVQSQVDESLLQRWARDDVASVASAAMPVVLARAASRDRFGRPGLDLADCPAELAVDLTYAVAAALSRHCDDADEELAAAAAELLARHDEGQRLEALEARLILALEQAGRLDSATLLALAGAGEVSLLAEALARLAGIPGESGWSLLADPSDGRLALLLRMAGQPRMLAAGLLVRLADALGIRDPEGEIDWFDRIDEGQAAHERAKLRLPITYLTAAAALEGHGHFPA